MRDAAALEAVALRCRGALVRAVPRTGPTLVVALRLGASAWEPLYGLVGPWRFGATARVLLDSPGHGRARSGGPCSVASASDDLRDALVAHAHYLGDGRHGESVLVSPADGLVAFLAQDFACLLKCLFALGVARGEGHKAGSSVGGLAFAAGDSRIV
jgi:hypothetical protein